MNKDILIERLEVLQKQARLNSDDIQHQTACYVIRGDKGVNTAVNKFPRGVEVTEERQQRPDKYIHGTC